MKTVRLSLILTMLLLIAACGSPAAPTDNGGGAAASSAPASTVASTAAASAAPAASTGASTAAAGGAPIVIGGGFNLTGGLSSLDVPAANGAKLALKEINDAGGVLGRPLEMPVRDGKSDSATVGNNTTQFIESDKAVVLIGYTDSDSALAAGPIAEKANVPFITVGATSPNLPSQVGKTMFLAPFGDNVQAAAGAEFIFNNLKLKRGYLLKDKGTEYTTLLAKYFKQRFEELSGAGSLAGEDTYQTGDKDYSAQITKIKALSPTPEFLYISALPDDIGTIVKQVRDAGITVPIVGGDGYDTPLLIQVGGPAAENVYFSTHSLIDPQGGTDAVKKFIKDYQAANGNPPDNAFAALGYDTVKLVADAIKRAGSTDAAAIIKALEETKNFKGVTGDITYSADSHVPQKGVTIIAVKGGKFTLGAEIVPQKVPAP